MKNATQYDFDVIVVGGGHAGIEAAYAAARMGSRTLLVTLDIQKIGLMPCNPAIGGVGKGHIVYEISALGGLMPQLCTQTYLQARMLNTKKGAAVQGLRLQIDKYAYNKLSIDILSHTENLHIVNGKVSEIIIRNKVVEGIVTEDTQSYTAPSVILTAGTFLNGRIHIGTDNYAGGRRDEEAVVNLSLFLQSHGLAMGRLKTGTPPRLLRTTINFDVMEKQEADNLSYLFEFHPHQVTNTRDCFITHTNAQTHEVIRKNIHLSAMYSGNISGIGPRYCPSIEDKIARFPDKSSHHVFVEPESASCDEIYPNGISTSLPYPVQIEYVRTIRGFEDAVITKPGYAIEYDFVFPHQLKHTLEVRAISGLFLAGQINGTTGYEEAAGQGIIAGINAHLHQRKLPPFILDRTESYIGVMIDDLVTMGVDEPYRMFTSRAERRLLLRQDNSFLRLTEKSYHLGLIREELYQNFCNEKSLIETTLQRLRKGHNDTTLLHLFGGLSCNNAIIRDHAPQQYDQLSDRALQTIHAEIRYKPYLERELKEVELHKKYAHVSLSNVIYKDMPGLSKELQQKLERYKPSSVAQASSIPGMTPAALSLLVIAVKRDQKYKRCSLE